MNSMVLEYPSEWFSTTQIIQTLNTNPKLNISKLKLKLYVVVKKSKNLKNDMDKNNFIRNFKHQSVIDIKSCKKKIWE